MTDKGQGIHGSWSFGDALQRWAAQQPQDSENSVGAVNDSGWVREPPTDLWDGDGDVVDGDIERDIQDMTDIWTERMVR